jgi:hypothetical protein
VLENKLQDIDDLATIAGIEQVLLYCSEGSESEMKAHIAKSAALPCTPRDSAAIVNRLSRSAMQTADDATMPAYGQTLRCNRDTVWITRALTGRLAKKGCKPDGFTLQR